MENPATGQTPHPLAPPHTDLRARCWFDAFLPPFMREWARLGRWDRMTGVWLLFWPCVWGLLLSPAFVTLSLTAQARWVLLFFAGSFAMRGAGCTINDLWDRKLDAQVARTAGRPLAAGRIGVAGALVFLTLQLAAGLAVLWQLPLAAQVAALCYVPLIVLYPLMKRITAWPQAFLAIVFSAGSLVGWLAVGPFTPLVIILYVTNMLWVLGYDTIYAHMDRNDDALIGIKSTVIHLGERAVDLVVVCWWCVFTGWGLIFAFREFPPLACSLLIFSAIMQLLNCIVWNPDDDKTTLNYFQTQRWFGAVWALCCWYAVLQHLPASG